MSIDFEKQSVPADHADVGDSPEPARRQPASRDEASQPQPHPQQATPGLGPLSPDETCVTASMTGIITSIAGRASKNLMLPMHRMLPDWASFRLGPKQPANRKPNASVNVARAQAFQYWLNACVNAVVYKAAAAGRVDNASSGHQRPRWGPALQTQNDQQVLFTCEFKSKREDALSTPVQWQKTAQLAARIYALHEEAGVDGWGVLGSPGCVGAAVGHNVAALQMRCGHGIPSGREAMELGTGPVVEESVAKVLFEQNKEAIRILASAIRHVSLKDEEERFASYASKRATMDSGDEERWAVINKRISTGSVRSGGVCEDLEM
ncbi:hypothetical protein AAE478_007303 [Parahypoxylon ruwenzoriense]